MLFLKSLIFIPANMLVAFLIVFVIRFVLFYPRKQLHLFSWQVPLTPGLVHKYHKLLIDKINDLIYGYLHDAHTSHDNNRIDGWEKQIFEKCLAWLQENVKIERLPEKINYTLQLFLAEVCREFASQFMRSFIPYIVQYYDLTSYVEIFKQTFTVKFLQGYFDQYVYKYSLYFMLSLGFLIGITNEIIYLIIGG